MDSILSAALYGAGSGFVIGYWIGGMAVTMALALYAALGITAGVMFIWTQKKTTAINHRLTAESLWTP
ncbi:hypothetical protein [Arenimonas terrae]|nr:hypothetical protein [Arenimonas terrae]